ncbi:unnamed protein product [Bursaphelenchus okinawaensis]|uniref:Bromo domain-containing protein n=1 Tax=Bursaphelenchus okinawaensis TaxID=465554 RepID=A0A811LM01_9BILA|nr:unnamed protein product [Bursaphelenchus okinawaensis]CAG9124161.1 unnamed protein product [Bursaphelenchus okinawaensis]
MTEVGISLATHITSDKVSNEEETEWTPEELHILLDLTTRFKEWEVLATKMNEEFGANRPEDFFTASVLKHKFSRLSGESCGKKPDMEVLAWIKQFLKRTTTERNSSGDVAKIARIRRYFELWQHASQGKLTEHQLQEVIGLKMCKTFLGSSNFPNEDPEKQLWLDSDLFRSKLSKDEWNNLRNPEELITKLKNNTVNKERFLFEHPELKKAEEEAAKILQKQEEDARLMSPPDLKRKRVQVPSPSVTDSPKAVKSESTTPGPDIIMIEPEPEVVLKRLKSPEQATLPIAAALAEIKPVEIDAGSSDVHTDGEDSEKEKVVEELKAGEQPVAKRLRGRSATTSSDVSTPTTSAQPSPAPVPSTRSSPRHAPSDNEEKRTLRTKKLPEKVESPKKVEGTKKEVLDNGFEPESGTSEVEESTKFAAPEVSTMNSIECQTTLTFIRINRSRSLSPSKKKLEKTNSSQKELATEAPVAQCSQSSTDTAATIKTESDDQIVEFPNVGLQTEPLDLKRINVDEEIIYVGESLDESKVQELLAQHRDKSQPPGEAPKERRRSRKSNAQGKKFKIVIESGFIQELYPFLLKNEDKLEDDERSEASDTSRSSSKRRSTRHGTGSQELAKKYMKSSKTPTLFLESAHLLKNPDVALPPPSTKSPHDPIIRSAHNIIMQQKSANIFMEPVTAEVENYFDFVKYPMDLSTIQKFIDEGRLKSMSELQELYNLMCANAIMFNENGHTVNQDAKELKKLCFETTRELIYAPQRKVAKRHSIQTNRFSTRRLTQVTIPKILPHHASQPHLVPGTAKAALPLTRRTFVNAALYRTRRFKQEKREDSATSATNV